MNNTPKPGRSYDEQFKRDAVALLEGGRQAAQLARDLGVSPWNLRDWRRLYGTGAAAASHTQARSAALAGAGGPGAVAALRRRGLRHGKNRVRRLMREQHLQVRQKCRFVPRTTQADKTSHPSPNRLGAQPAPTRPNQAWVTDICFAALTLRAALRAGCLASLGSYLLTGEGWLYIAAEMDLLPPLRYALRAA